MNKAIAMSDLAVLKYLRDINAKVTSLLEKVANLEKRVDKIGEGCREAFGSTKEVISSLHAVTRELALQQKGVREDLAEYGGVIEADSWWS